MKLKLLPIAMFLFACRTMAQAPLEARILSVNPDPNTYTSNKYDISIRVINRQIDSILPGDTIVFYDRYNNELFEVGILPIRKTIYKDSSADIMISGNYIEDHFDVIGKEGKHSGLNYETYRRNKKMIYYSAVDLQTVFPVLGYTHPFIKIQDLNYFSQIAQLDFKFYGSRAAQVPWNITDNHGRRIAHGFLDVRVGLNPYTIVVDNLKAGRYTLSIGNGADEEDEDFTVLR